MSKASALIHAAVKLTKPFPGKLVVIFLAVLFLLSHCAVSPAPASPMYRQIFFPPEQTSPGPLIPEGDKTIAVKGSKTLTNLDLIHRLPFSFQALSATDLLIQKDSGEFHNFMKEFQVNWRIKEERTLKFTWGTRQSNVSSAVWQVSTLRFSPDPSQWETVPGLVASGHAPVKAAQPGEHPYVFMVDFGAFAPLPPNEHRAELSPSLKPKQLKPVSIKPSIQAVVTKPKTIAPSTISRVETPKADLARETLNMTFYVRVVPLDQRGGPAGIPSEPVSVYYGDPLPDGSIQVFPETFQKPEAVHPQVLALSYEPIQQQAQDAMYHVIALKDIPLYCKKGDKLDLTPKPEKKNVLDHIGDAISSIGDFISGAVNWVSGAYESIKGYAVDAACSIAGERFRGTFEMGLNMGLAAIGLPPSIPNFDELTSMGKDYLVAVIVEEATGLGIDPLLAQEAAEEGVEAFIREAGHQANGGGDPNAFFKPDPDFYYRPAYMDVVVKNNESQPSTPMIGLIKITVKDGAWDEDLFDPARFPIPSLEPGETFSLRVFLKENMENIFGDTSPYSGMQRFWSRYMMTAKVQVLSAAYTPRDPERPAHADYKYENPEALWQQFTIPDPRYGVTP